VISDRAQDCGRRNSRAENGIVAEPGGSLARQALQRPRIPIPRRRLRGMDRRHDGPADWQSSFRHPRPRKRNGTQRQISRTAGDTRASPHGQTASSRERSQRRRPPAGIGPSVRMFPRRRRTAVRHRSNALFRSAVLRPKLSNPSS
jgi:hypothetical protein